MNISWTKFSFDFEVKKNEEERSSGCAQSSFFLIEFICKYCKTASSPGHMSDCMHAKEK